MAEAMFSAKKAAEMDKTAQSDGTVQERPPENKGKKPVPRATKGKETPIVKSGTSSNPDNPTPAMSAFNKEALLILREMNSNINKTNDKVEKLSGRVDALYEYDEYDNEPYYDEYDDYENECPDPSETVSVSDKRSVEDDDSDFSAIVKEFKKTDQCDKPVNQSLADLVNTTFKEGMSEDNYNENVRNIFRPENCESLKETRVNTGVWSVLRPQTQTEDSKMRGIQNCVVKAACNVTKLLHESSSELSPQSLERGTMALGLLGQANKWINVRRRELHKKDMDPKLHHLCSSAIPFSDLLYGDTIVKDIRDIQEINKIGKNVGSTRGYKARGRGGRSRGRGRPYPRRGFMGLYKGVQPKHPSKKTARRQS